MSDHHHRQTNTAQARSRENTCAATPLWVQTWVLEHYLAGQAGAAAFGTGGGGGATAYGAAARRKFARSRRFSGGSVGGGGSDGGKRDCGPTSDWGWVRVWAVPSSSTSTSGPSNPALSAAASSSAAAASPRSAGRSVGGLPPLSSAVSSVSSQQQQQQATDGPVSPFGHVKLRRVESSASSRFRSGQSQPERQNQQSQSQSSSSSSLPQHPTSARMHRSNSTPSPHHETEAAAAPISPAQSQSMTVTVRDPDYPDYDGQIVTLTPEHVKEGTVPANSWWTADRTEQPGGSGIGSDCSATAPSDLIALPHLHEPAVVHCLRSRYALGRVYTYTGPILLACNPFRYCDGLYGEEVMRDYWESGSGSGGGGGGDGGEQERLPPHVYAVADRAFRAMMRAFEDGGTSSANTNGGVGADSATVGGGGAPRAGVVRADQSILVSGESGAGKTVTTKIVMRYLATLSRRSSRASGGSLPSVQDPASAGGIESQVLQSNPILESFGNARTARNDNSSRFGKFIEIRFCRSGTLVGATVETYLLEKVRLIHPSAGERNYHVFYELLAGDMTRDEKAKLRLDYATPQDFAMTSTSGTYDRRDGVSDADTYRDLRGAMDTVGFTSEEQGGVLSVASALLFASNLTFVEKGRLDECMLDETNPSLAATLDLWGVTADDLNNALCACTIEAAGEKLRKVLSRDQSASALEALMMATYGALFRHIVGRVNRSITVGRADGDGVASTESGGASSSREEATAFISVLDIFGFESFALNSFEQLCINYCNEALQQQFNRFVFKLEQQEYEREGIEWSFISFPDNQEVLDLIEKRHTGIFSILDEQCRLARCTDQTFVNRTYEICSVHPRFVGSDREKVLGCFSVHHYAGPVEYNSASFLSKNKDDLPKETTDLLLSSSKPLLRELGEMLSEQAVGAASPPDHTGSSNPSRGALKRPSSSLSRASVGNQFSSQLRQLRHRIDHTSPHYVRCLKPNDDLVPDNFSPSIIADQLRCAGVLEAVRVSRVGYPQRYGHSLFVQRYGVLGGAELQSARRRRRDLCQTLVNAVVPQIWDYQKDGASTTANQGRKGHSFDLISVGVQMGKTKVFLRQRAFEALEHLRAEKMDRAATSIQSIVRMFLCRDSYMFVLESVIMVQSIFRGYRAKRFVEDVRHFYVATLIQSAWRRFVAWDDYNNILFLALSCQRMYRGGVTRQMFAVLNKDRRVVTIQSFWRMCHPYRRFRATLRLVINLQVLARSKMARDILQQLKREARDLGHIAKERDELRMVAQGLKRELEEIKQKSLEEAKQLHCSESQQGSIHAEGSTSVASTVGSVVYRDFPKNPSAQEEEIRALAGACTEKDREMERLRQELESIKEEKRTDFGGVPMRTVFATHSHPEGSFPDTPAATESTTPSSLGLPISPSGQSKRGLMLGRLDMLLKTSRDGEGSADCGSVASHSSRVSRNAASTTSASLLDREFREGYENGSPRKYSLQQNDSGELKAYAPAELIHAEDEFHETPLHEAVRAMDEDALSQFIDSHDGIYEHMNEGGHEGRTPLHIAVLGTNLSVTSLLLKNYAVANLQDDAGNTPLHYAEESRMIELLLGVGGANPNIPNGDGLCALHLAVRRKDVESVRCLLSHQADVTVADDIRWYTPLHLVAQSDGNARKNTVLKSHDFSRSGQIAKMLCQVTTPSEIDLNYQDRDGNTPLHHATVLADSEAEDLITIFLEQGSDPNIKNERGQTAMHLLCHNNALRQFDCYQNLLDVLVSQGGDPNEASLSGCTALHLCLYHRDIDSAVQLLHSGAQLHLPWRKPPKWEPFWIETGLPDVFCTDMVQDGPDLRRILAAITTRQERAPTRPDCMRCSTSFSSFGKRHHCLHCCSLVCKSCSSTRLVLSDLPDFCCREDGARVCNLCEDLLLSRAAEDKSPSEGAS